MLLPRRKLIVSAGALVWAACHGNPTLGAARHAAVPAADAAAPAPPRLVLPRTYRGQIEPADCLVSEKYDGVRAFWDGRLLRHRSGRTVPAPTWFIAKLPREALDGELWLGRGRFEALSSVVRQGDPDDPRWRDVSYQVFELPGADGSFAGRAAAIERLIDRLALPHVRAVRQNRCSTPENLRKRLDDTVGAGGEGLVLHLAAAPYETGRSDAVFKLKPALDAEAVVVGHRAGRGKYDGAVGALEVETPEGQRFLLGSGLPDAVRRAPPAPGTVVTYRYQERTGSGLPRFASFLRVHEAF